LARHGIGARLSQALFSLSYYTSKTALPFGLSPIYELPVDFNPWAWPYVAAGPVVLAAGFIFVLLRKRWPAGLAVAIYYATIVAPVSGIAQSGIQLVADRYSYLSCLGWALVAGGGMLYLSRRLHRRWKSLAVVWAFALTILIGLGALTWRQTQVWRDSKTLFQYIVTVRPGARAYMGLGTVLWNEGRLDEAILHYRQSLKFSPDYVLARVNLANALVNQGNLDEAVEHYRHVVGLNLAFLEFRLMAYNNLGILLIRQGKLQEAADCYREAIALAPAFQEAHSQLGAILLRIGKIDEAIEHHRKALELTPGSALLHLNLADALMARGEVDEASDQFRVALDLDPGLEQARRGLTMAAARRSVSPSKVGQAN
jgi:Flp pilus assembly protein TadD